MPRRKECSNCLVDSAHGGAERHLVPFSQVTRVRRIFLHVWVGKGEKKVVVTNGNGAAHRQRMKARREEQQYAEQLQAGVWTPRAKSTQTDGSLI